jgi:hypothetical protein
MSEIPNSMVKVGQTCSLTALVYYRDGTFSGSEPVVWASSRPSVARVDQYGNLVSLAEGTTAVSVTTVGRDANNQTVTDSHELIVSEEWSDYDNNIHPDVWRRLGIFNDSIQNYAEQLTFLDFDSDVMKKDPFASSFKSAYGVDPVQVTEISSGVEFSSNSSYSGSGGTPLNNKPSISVTLSGASPTSGGAVLPLRVVYGLNWDEVSGILGREVTKIDDPRELFGKMKLAFTDKNGKESVLVDNGREGIDASSKALALKSGNNGLSLTFDIFLSDALPASDGKPRLIGGNYLTAADGAADGSISGSLSLLKTAGGNDSSSESGGGGGCDAGFGILAIVAALFFMRENRRVR